MWVPGRWDWNGRWYWGRGYCGPARQGYMYVAPRYVGGVYYRGHWARGGGTYVTPPPPRDPGVDPPGLRGRRDRGGRGRSPVGAVPS